MENIKKACRVLNWSLKERKEDKREKCKKENGGKKKRELEISELGKLIKRGRTLFYIAITEKEPHTSNPDTQSESQSQSHNMK